MANGPNTTSNTADIIPAGYFDRRLQEAVRGQNVHVQFASLATNPDGTVALPQQSGTTVYFTKLNALTPVTSPGSETADPTPELLSVSRKSATVDVYDKLVTASALFDETAAFRFAEMAIPEVAANAAESIDRITADVLAASTNVFYAGGKTARTALSYQDLLTPALVKRAARFLEINNVPKINGAYIAIIHPSVKHDLISDDLWVSVAKYSTPTQLFTGEIGSLYGVRFIETSNAKVFSDAGSSGGVSSGASASEIADVYSTAFFGAGAYGVVSLDNLRFVSGLDPKVVTQKIWYAGWVWVGAAVILDQNFIVRVESGSTVYAEG